MQKNCLGTAGEQLRQVLFSPSPQPSPRSTGARELFFGGPLATNEATQPTAAKPTMKASLQKNPRAGR